MMSSQLSVTPSALRITASTWASAPSFVISRLWTQVVVGPGRPHDLEVAHAGEEPLDALPQQVVVLGDHDPHAGSIARHGPRRHRTRAGGRRGRRPGGPAGQPIGFVG